MSLIAELTLHGDVILFDRTFAAAPDAVAAFEDVHYVTEEDDHRHYVFFWLVSAPDHDAFERGLAADDTVAEFRHVTVVEDRALYRIVTVEFPPDQPLVFPAFREHDVTAIDSRRDADGLHLRARFPNRDALDGFLDAAADGIASHVEVVRLYTEDSTAAREPALTDCQRNALQLAHARGYFDTPSEVTLSELAEAFDVTPQTMSRHIRVGVKKLVGDAVASVAPRDAGSPT